MQSSEKFLIWVSLISSAVGSSPIRLRKLNIDRGNVAAVGLGHSADFAHQFHISFSSLVTGSCIFSGQPFYCAVQAFNQDVQVNKTPTTRVPTCNGCKSENWTLPFDHCKLTPNVVDVGAVVDYPRRHCGQNPIKHPVECIDSVEYFMHSRVFLFRGSHDEQYLPGAVENTVGLLAQMIKDPAGTMRYVNDQPFPHILPLNSTPHVNSSEPAGYDGPGECLRHVFDAALSAGESKESNWAAFDQTEFSDKDAGDVGFQGQGWLYIPDKCKSDSEAGSCRLVLRPDKCTPEEKMFAPDASDFAKYAEANGIVILHPCVGGPVNKSKYPQAPDVEEGRLDVYGQLTSNYIEQSAPQMRAIGNMLRRVLGVTKPAPADPPIQSRASSQQQADVPHFLFLDVCDASNPYHRWSGDALLHPGTFGAVSNVGGGQCLSTANPHPAMVEACGKAPLFHHNLSTQQIDSGKSNRCLDVNGGLGPELIFWSCHTLKDADFSHQQFAYNSTSGLLTSLSSITAGLCVTLKACLNEITSPSTTGQAPGPVVTMPTLNIDRASVMTAGCSNDADFAHQFHVAFGSLVTGSCIFSGQPFNCAVTVFPKSYFVPKTPSTAAGIHCPACPPNGTLPYDHCKNHAQFVDVDMLAEYAETAADVDDPKVHLVDARVFAFGPTHDRCYQPPAMENVANFHRRYAKFSSQVLLVEDQPFPHLFPVNSTPYFNHSEAARYDGPGECLRHVWGHKEPIHWAVPCIGLNLFNTAWQRINVSEFVTDLGVGMMPSAWLFVPPPCQQREKCKLLILPGGCDAFHDPPPKINEIDDWTRYAIVNKIVILKPCQGGPIDPKRFPHNHENLRGMVDVYGQLSANYATQKGYQMEPIGKMVKRLLGINHFVYV